MGKNMNVCYENQLVDDSGFIFMNMEPSKIKILKDEELVELFQDENDDKVFEEIYLRYKERIFNYIRNFLYFKDEGSIREILNDVFVTVYRELPRLRHKEAFKVWLYRIARSAGIKVIRKEKTRRVFMNNEEAVTRYYFQNTQHYPDPEKQLIKKELRLFVFKEINNLNQKDREIIMLRFYNDFKFDEISRITGIPLRTTKYRLKNALIKINAKLKKEGYLV